MSESDEQRRTATLRQVIAGLASVQDQLLATPPGDLATRHRLHQRQDRLRTQAALLRDELPLSAEERVRLERRRRLLRRRLDELTRRGVRSLTTVGSLPDMGGGLAVDNTMVIDRDLIEAGDPHELREELALIDQRLG